MAHRIMIVDTHIDIPAGASIDNINRFIDAPDGQFDYEKARQGGLNMMFMAIYVPPIFEDSSNAREFTDERIDLLYSLTKRWPDKFEIFSSPVENSLSLDTDKVYIALGIENGTAIQGDITNLHHFYERGIRYITLVHSKNNRICDSSFDEEKKWHGVSPFGTEVIKEMNKLGIMVDVSHASDESFYQIVELSGAPVIASHSGCRYFTPGFERNLTDSMIQMIAAKGGVVQVPVGSFFLTAEFSRMSMAAQKEMDQFLAEHHLSENDSPARKFWQDLKIKYPADRGDVRKVVDHIDQVVKLVGVDYVGIGSDFEGVTTVPPGLEDVSKYPNIIAELLRREYRQGEIKKIFGENLMRVWRQTEKISRQIEYNRRRN